MARNSKAPIWSRTLDITIRRAPLSQKVHLNTSRYSEMKEKEVQVAARSEIDDDKSKINIPDTDTFVTLQEADGFTGRKEFDVSNDMRVKFYQSNVLSPYLSLFFKERIVQNITQKMN